MGLAGARVGVCVELLDPLVGLAVGLGAVVAALVGALLGGCVDALLGCCVDALLGACVELLDPLVGLAVRPAGLIITRKNLIYVLFPDLHSCPPELSTAARCPPTAVRSDRVLAVHAFVNVSPC